MEIYEWIFIGLFVATIIVVSGVAITKLVVKPSLKKMRISTYFWFKSATVKFKSFDSFVTHSFSVIPKKEYEAVYQLETEAGEVRVRLYGQLDVSTTSRKEGSKIVSFNRFQPVVDFQGDKAKNGKCSVKLYKKRS